MISRCAPTYFLLLLIIYIPSSFSAITFQDGIFPELATSARAQAMGNAFQCRVEDASAVFYNPAGLGTVRFSHLHFTNIHLESNKNWFDATTNGGLLGTMGNFMKGFSLDGSRELLLENKGTISYGRYHAIPNLTTRYASIGYLYSKQTRTTLGKEAGAQFEYATRQDHGPYAALNLSIFGGVVKAGASVIWLNRSEAIGEADPNIPLVLTDTDYKSGSAFIGTAGARITLPIKFLPTFSGVVHNALRVPFVALSGSGGAPDTIKSSMDAGFSITPQIGRTTRVHIEVNYKDLSREYSDLGSLRRILFGVEFDMARVVFVRFGYGDGFLSGGIGVKTQSVEFDLTTYAVDTTTNEFRGQEDRHFAFSLSSGF
ncbi:MAG: hypothetical protein ISR65_01835 [Bacteriovoracaceae bacterium]|nr:hypothetical protein [Bacteriovoracaceae bacterium]